MPESTESPQSNRLPHAEPRALDDPEINAKLARLREKYPQAVLTIDAEFEPQDALENAERQALAQLLKTFDCERGRIVREPFLGLVEFECRADKALELWKELKKRFPCFKVAVCQNIEDPDFSREYLGHNAEFLFPLQDVHDSLEATPLVAEMQGISDPFNGIDLGGLARAIRTLLSDSAEPRNYCAPGLVRAWLNLSAEIVDAAYKGANELTRSTLLSSLKGTSATVLARRLLEKARMDLGASGYALFVRDPHLKGVFREVVTEGIAYPEMLTGFSGFTDAGWVFDHTEPEVYCTNLEDTRKLPKAKWLSGATRDKKFRDLMGRENKKVFGYYFVREQLSAMVVLHGSVQDARTAAYINFKAENGAEIVFGNRVRAYLRALNKDLADLFGKFQEETFIPADLIPLARLSETARELTNFTQRAQKVASFRTQFEEKAFIPADPIPLARLSETAQKLTNFTQRSQKIASFRTQDVGEQLGEYFKGFLLSAMEVLGVSAAGGLATIHALNPESDVLYLIEAVGNIPRPIANSTKFQKIFAGEGGLSWVALHRRPIRIGNIKLPKFNGLINEFNTESKSVLAVPMCAGDELVGVLNIESMLANHFSQDQLVMLAYVANQVAIAWRNFHQVRLDTDVAAMHRQLSKHIRLTDLVPTESLWKIIKDPAVMQSTFDLAYEERRQNEIRIPSDQEKRWMNQVNPDLIEETNRFIRSLMKAKDKVELESRLNDANPLEALYNLDRWFSKAVQKFKADAGDVWKVDDWPDDDNKPITFERAIQSPDLPADLKPDDAGWTQYVARTQQTVCIAGITEQTDFNRAFLIWDSESSKFRWSEDPPPGSKWPVPKKVHKTLIKKFVMEIGIPLTSKDGDCYGVMWLKYQVPNEQKVAQEQQVAQEKSEAAEEQSVVHGKECQIFPFRSGFEWVPKEDRVVQLRSVASEHGSRHWIDPG